MLVGLRSETDFLHLNLHLLGLHLLLALLLLVKEFGIVDQTTNGRIGIRGNLYEIYPLLMGHIQCITGRNYGRTFVAYDANFTHSDLFINPVLTLQFVILHPLFFKNRLQSYE